MCKSLFVLQDRAFIPFLYILIDIIFLLSFPIEQCVNLYLCCRIEILSTADPVEDKRYMAYITSDKIGMVALPVDGNPHNSMALISHPGGVSLH